MEKVIWKWGEIKWIDFGFSGDRIYEGECIDVKTKSWEYDNVRILNIFDNGNIFGRVEATGMTIIIRQGEVTYIERTEKKKVAYC